MNNYQKSLLARLDGSPHYRRIREWAEGADASISAEGLAPGAASYLYARLAADFPRRPILILTATNDQADHLLDDLQFFGIDGALGYPRWEALPYETEEPIHEIAAQQIETLAALASFTANAKPAANPKSADAKSSDAKSAAAAPRIVASIESMLTKTLSNEAFRAMSVRFAWGERVDVDKLAARLVDMGYERVGMVEARGEFGVRGGIVDVFPLDMDNPLRLDLFGDEIESIRFFDPSTQRSLPEFDNVESIAIHPVRPRRLYEERARAGETLVPFWSLLPKETLIVLDHPEAYDLRLERFEQLVERQHRAAWEDQAHIVSDTEASLLPRTPHDDDEDEDDAGYIPVKGAKKKTTSAKDEENVFRGEIAEEREKPLEPAMLYATRAELEKAISSRKRLMNTVITADSHDAHHVAFRTMSFEGVEPKLEAHLSLMSQRQQDGYAVHIVCDNEGQVERLDEVLRERQLAAIPLIKQHAPQLYHPREAMEGFHDIALVVGDLHAGFSIPEIQISLVTDREIFGRYKKRRVYKKVHRGAPIALASEIHRGDYVVHAEHGVGEFLGVRRQMLDGRATELLEILYRDNNKLLVPVDKIRLVQKYTSVEGSAPTLDRLGGKQWAKRKEKAQEAVEVFAKELLEIYAKRTIASAADHGFDTDTVWMREFEASFIHQETPDQLTAIEAVKDDLRLEKPMDRLICGDVGYGKTEVAIRAAFKMVEAKKQVAVLAPTTILAQQHYNTFRERFADYPFQVGVLSRFRTAAEQKDTVDKIATGEMSLVVGTHRLLSQDVRFVDLGLLIIDEEQRFGVKQKEKIKSLRASVDVLTLTATPIPRTLYMALSGLRDMSVIQTPPPDRQPIRTKVIHFNKEQIEEALLRELNRGGQVYFVHNRVHNIDQVVKSIQEIVPEAKIAIGHGQMNEHELEKVMLEFIDGKHDILVATTIIENGLDIPNVNTIVINRADTFGLAQLYQLRGRVGRSGRRAYAYLVVPQGQPLTDTAVRRLAAIQEFTSLGSGFNVAMRDMEIRGAGDLLGQNQHGAIQHVGFDLYCQLLEEAVHKLKGEYSPLDTSVEVQWKAESYVPSEYVPIESHRIALYKRLANAKRQTDVAEILAEMRDRYGAAPKPVENICALAALRVSAVRLQVQRVVETKTGFKLFASENKAELAEELAAFQKKSPSIAALSMEADGSIAVTLKAKAEEKIAAAAEVLERVLGAIEAGAVAASGK